jgi:hypothetical protein
MEVSEFLSPVCVKKESVPRLGINDPGFRWVMSIRIEDSLLTIEGCETGIGSLFRKTAGRCLEFRQSRPACTGTKANKTCEGSVCTESSTIHGGVPVANTIFYIG